MRAAGLALLITVMLPVAAASQSGPFGPGERLTYEARTARFGRIGRAVMEVGGIHRIRGREAHHLRFAIDTKVGFVHVQNVSESCLDVAGMSSLRFAKREQHPLSRRQELVEIFPEEQRWEAADGASGPTMSAQPLDELSFIYFLRTVELPGQGDLRFDRHYAAERNPTLVHVIGRETLATPAGTFATIVVEMQVRDGRYRGDGTIRVHLSDDRRRLPVRIESAVPFAGRTVLTLESHSALEPRDTAGR